MVAIVCSLPVKQQDSQISAKLSEHIKGAIVHCACQAMTLLTCDMMAKHNPIAWIVFGCALDPRIDAV